MQAGSLIWDRRPVFLWLQKIMTLFFGLLLQVNHSLQRGHAMGRRAELLQREHIARLIVQRLLQRNPVLHLLALAQARRRIVLLQDIGTAHPARLCGELRQRIGFCRLYTFGIISPKRSRRNVSRTVMQTNSNHAAWNVMTLANA